MEKHRAVRAGVLYAVGLVLLILGILFSVLVLVTGGAPALPQSSSVFVQAVNTFLSAGLSNSILLLITGLAAMSAAAAQRDQLRLQARVKKLCAHAAELEEQTAQLSADVARLQQERSEPAAPVYAACAPQQAACAPAEQAAYAAPRRRSRRAEAAPAPEASAQADA